MLLFLLISNIGLEALNYSNMIIILGWGGVKGQGREVVNENDNF